MHAIICIFDFMNLMLFIIKFTKLKPIAKFNKFELHNYAYFEIKARRHYCAAARLNRGVPPVVVISGAAG